jgi:hypothetical protein
LFACQLLNKPTINQPTIDSTSNDQSTQACNAFGSFGSHSNQQQQSSDAHSLVSSNLNHAAAWSVNTFNAIHHASNHAWLLGNNGALRAMMQTIG